MATVADIQSQFYSVVDRKQRVWARPRAGGKFIPVASKAFDYLLRKTLGERPKKAHLVAIKDALSAAAIPVRMEPLSYYDLENHALWINIGDGGAARVTPHEVHIGFPTEGNIGFRDEDGFTPVPWQELTTAVASGELSAGLPALRRLIQDRLPPPAPDTILTQEEHVALVAAFWFSIFLRDRCSGGRLLLVFVGEPATGKTVTGRTLGTALYGEQFDVGGGAGLGRLTKDFAAGASAHALVVRDDVNSAPDDVVDLLNRISTGGHFEMSSLYETLQSERFPCIAAMFLTAYRPGWARRFDFLSRLALVRIGRSGGAVITEETRRKEILHGRVEIWAETLLALRKACGPLPERQLRSRFGDYEGAIGPILDAAGLGAAFDSALEKLPDVRRVFAMGADSTMHALYLIASDPANQGRRWSAAELVDEIARIFGASRPDREPHLASPTIRNAAALSKWLGMLELEGEAVVVINRIPGHDHKLYWTIRPRGDAR